MIYLPLRRFLLPAFVFLLLIVIYRSTSQRLHVIPSFIIHHTSETQNGTRILIGPRPARDGNQPLPGDDPRSALEESHYNLWHSSATDAYSQSIQTSPELALLWSCPRKPNQHTDHIRLPSPIQSISMNPPSPHTPEVRQFWNPTIFALPPWSKHPYIMVSRVVTDGSHQDNVICEAYTCYGPTTNRSVAIGERACSHDDVRVLGPAGGLRCATLPVRLNVPSTPAKQCEGKYWGFVDIPGFHDPRIFWSGRGEPLMMINSHSQYGCFGLWVTDLRSLYEPLNQILSNITAFSFDPSSPIQPTTPLLPYSPSPLASYPFLTEITRTPASSRHGVEKNWFLFFPSPFESYVHYDVADPSSSTRGRTFAKLLGSGVATSNLTDRTEISCFHNSSTTTYGGAQGGEWHQSSNSLRLILCAREDSSCIPGSENTVLFAIVHRKMHNQLGLPLRYERYAMVWLSSPPFSMIGISQHPLLLADEIAPGWLIDQNWDGSKGNERSLRESWNRTLLILPEAGHLPPKNRKRGQDNTNESTPPSQGFTYTVSVAWAFRKSSPEAGRKASTATGSEQAGGKILPSMQTGYWDDDLILGIGVKDVGQAFGRVKASDLLECLRACPKKDGKES